MQEEGEVKWLLLRAGCKGQPVQNSVYLLSSLSIHPSLEPPRFDH